MADLSVTVRAYASKARRMNVATAGTGTSWLQTLSDEALSAVSVGDEELTSTSWEGGSSTTARKFNAQDLLEATQLALEQLAAIPLEADVPSGPSHIDYSRRSAL